MKPALRHQLAHLDRSLVALLNERARLLSEVPAQDPGRLPAVDDLLRRNSGPITAESLRDVFEAIARACHASYLMEENS